MKRHILRLLAILILSLFTGLIYNQVQPRGIPFRLLTLPLGGPPRSAAWQPMSADSAFFCLIQKSALFVDIRPAELFSLDRIPGAVSAPYNRLFRSSSVLQGRDRHVHYIVYDDEVHSEKAVSAVRLLLKEGFTHVSFLRNGYSDWITSGFPVEEGAIREK